MPAPVSSAKSYGPWPSMVTGTRIIAVPPPPRKIFTCVVWPLPVVTLPVFEEKPLLLVGEPAVRLHAPTTTASAPNAAIIARSRPPVRGNRNCNGQDQ